MMTMSRRAAIGLAAAAAFVARPALALPLAGLKFQIYRDSRSAFRWRLKAGNGKQIAKSDEGYKTKAACQKTVDLIMAEAASATVEDLS